jgi:LacI family transcriptional regulator, galactose operon repressor
MLMERNRVFTIKEIAAFAGVAKSTVSEVINDNPKSRVSAKTFTKVKRIIDKYNYVPQISARTLATRRTFQIGFLVSTKATLGLSNAYFATIQSGVSDACKERGYQMVVSTYDLSDIKNFVMPKKLSQRSVDALIVAGSVSQEVLNELQSLPIPFIVIGGEYSEDILCLRSDTPLTYFKMVDHLIKHGHRFICCGSSDKISHSDLEKGISRIPEITAEELRISYKLFHGGNEYINGVKLAEDWLHTPTAQRFTAFLANEQVCCGFLAELVSNGIKCPDEISIMSCSDTYLCAWNSIPISAASSPLAEFGILATDLLIDLLGGKKDICAVKAALQKVYRPYDLIIRKTTGPAPKTIMTRAK